MVNLVFCLVKPSTRNSNRSVSAWISDNWRKIFAELLSTLMLVLFGCMTTIPGPGTTSPVHSALGFGMVVMFNIQIFGHVSGAYMNPAVTLSAVIFGEISITLGIAHILAECLGSVAGFRILDAMTYVNAAQNAVCVTAPLDKQNVFQNLGIETAITATLILINAAAWDPVNKQFKEVLPIKFGLSILGLSLVGGPFTGASMNPARSLGPAVWSGVWTQHWIYWVGPFLGSIIGTLIYKSIFLRKPVND